MAADEADLYDRLRMTTELLSEVEQALEAQLEYHLDRQLKSLDFIRSIRTPSPTLLQSGREAEGWEIEMGEA
jgi:hypothetical protein